MTARGHHEPVAKRPWQVSLDARPVARVDRDFVRQLSGTAALIDHYSNKRMLRPNP